MKVAEVSMLNSQMDALDMDNSLEDPPLKAGPMEDSFFPFISDSYNHFLASRDSDLEKSCRTQSMLIAGHEHSDMEADSRPESQMELTEVADVYTTLEHKEKDLILAAELGKSLLEKNEQLVQENDRLNQEYQERLEVLEQEKYELRRRLQFKTNESEASAVQFNSDIKRTQEELQEQKAMLAAVEREKSRALEELSDQNQKLVHQLHRSSAAEEQLSAQVQQLRKEFIDRNSSTSVKILQLESLKEQIEQGSETRAKLENNFDVMKEETLHLREALAAANERTHNLERHLHDKEREMKRVMVELNDAHVLNTQLQVRVDEMREELSLQMSFASTGNSSLLAELEQSGVDCNGILDISPTSELDHNTKVEETFQFPSEIDMENKKTVISDDPIVHYYQALQIGISNCHHQLFELKQEMWEVYQRIQSTCTVLRAFSKKQETATRAEDNTTEEDEIVPHSPSAINLSSALEDLSSLVHDVLKSKERPGNAGDIIRELKEKQTSLIVERDEAVAAKNHLEVNLASAKVDLMSVNSQLIEAIQQKLQQQKELEAWQDDMEQMIQKALNERNEQTKAKSLHRIKNATQQAPQQKSTWSLFSRRTRNPSESSVSSGNDTSVPVSPQLGSSTPLAANGDVAQTKPSRFSAWLRRKQAPDQDTHSSDSTAPS
ncbi:BICD family-like cargo adapter 1 isoform X2 [Clavelina lepadiformis]|uniref:BICD family-like cargo adapter 1 isoform X2 n=1 Tax=Clavelina lepadiformis TaxID=159417 RepID=UPI004043710B